MEGGERMIETYAEKTENMIKEEMLPFRCMQNAVSKKRACGKIITTV